VGATNVNVGGQFVHQWARTLLKRFNDRQVTADLLRGSPATAPTLGFERTAWALARVKGSRRQNSARCRLTSDQPPISINLNKTRAYDRRLCACCVPRVTGCPFYGRQQGRSSGVDSATASGILATASFIIH
jgi:hypothetical protein